MSPHEEEGDGVAREVRRTLGVYCPGGWPVEDFKVNIVDGRKVKDGRTEAHPRGLTVAKDIVGPFDEIGLRGAVAKDAGL